jgi:hypothetical protein
MRDRPVLSALAGSSRSETRRRPCAASARVRVENDAGLVSITAWERDELEVVADKHGPDDQSLDRLVVEVSGTAEAILVTYTSDQPVPDAWVDFSIRCPRLADLDLHTASGEVLLSGFHGQSRAATASGTIRAARMRGTATLTSASGSIEGAALEGTIYARSASGRVSLHGRLTGSHRVETASGDIVVDGVEGSIDARSASGGISVAGRLTPGSAIRTVSGDIDVRLLPGSEVSAQSLRAETTSGRVDVREPGPLPD